eukprot:2437852-Rhodomonas_salina.1
MGRMKRVLGGQCALASGSSRARATPPCSTLTPRRLLPSPLQLLLLLPTDPPPSRPLAGAARAVWAGAGAAAAAGMRGGRPRWHQAW